MIDHAQARHIAQQWLDDHCRLENDRLLIQDTLTTEHSFGWVFSYHSERWLRTRDSRYAIAGNAPLIIDRADGSVHTTTTAEPVELAIAEYEHKRNAPVLPLAEISSSLPSAEVEIILAMIRARTEEILISLTDGERGPVVRTGQLYGHEWHLRRAPSGWKIFQKFQWAS